MGILHREFRDRHGQSHGLRMEPVELRADPGAEGLVLFIGDSFTNGHGVPRDQNFPSLAAAALGGRLTGRNLGRNGDSTRQERERLDTALAAAASPVAVVVHQYVGNDIQDHVDLKIVPAGGVFGPALLVLSQVSYLVDYLYNPFFMAGIGEGPLLDLLDAYRDRDVMDDHRAELLAMWERAHQAGAGVLFVIFPFLVDRRLHALSDDAYVRPLAALFQQACHHGDAVLDVSDIVATESGAGGGAGGGGGTPDYRRWVVNMVDAHPSALLHRRVAEEILRHLGGRPGLMRPCQR